MSLARVGIVLCHEVWGISPPLRAVADCHDRDGHAVAIADFYGGRCATDYGQAAAYRDALTLLDIRAAVQRGVDDVRREGAARVAVVGYSMGGSIALWAAACLRVDLAVTYYGGGLARPYWCDMPAGVELARRLARPWIGFYGGRDPVTPAAELQALAEAASTAPVPGRVVIYEGADHGFALDPADSRHDTAAAASASAEVQTALRSLTGDSAAPIV